MSIFNVTPRDAGQLIKDLQGKVKVDDIISLDCYEAIARIGTDIVKIRTFPPMKMPEENFKDRIIESSRRRHYKPAHEVREAIRRRIDDGKCP